MSNSRNSKVIFRQIITWVVFYIVSLTLYKIHYGMHLDNYFILRFSASALLFLLINLYLTQRFSPSNLEKIEDKLILQEKEFKKLKEKLVHENRLYKILFESIDDPVFVITNKMNIFFYNHKLANLFNIKDELTNVPLIEITRNFEFQNVIKSSIKLNKQMEILSFSFANEQDPDRQYFDLKIIPIKFSNHFLCVLHNVTVKKLADQMREDFISNFSHEIRTPLTILNGQLQGLKNILKSSPETEKTFIQIENNSRRLTNLFDDMLNLTSIEKKMSLNFEKFALAPMLDITTQDLQFKYPEKNISFEFDLIQSEIYGDYNLIEQLLINLLENSIKYSNNSPIVKVSTSIEGDFVALTIKDNGIGIPEDQKHRIFERFYRVDNSRSNDINGTGLGLAIVKHIVQKHNGKLKVESEVNAGTKIILFFPIQN